MSEAVPSYKRIDQIPIHSRKVFIRVDYNVNLKNGKIQDDTRIRETLPTLEYALGEKAKLILASHLGRPKGVRQEELSLLPVAEYLSDLLGRDVLFPEDCAGDAAKKLAHDLRDGEVMLLENLRFHLEEELNEPNFSAKLASLAEVYINDAFGTAHRAHASTVGMVSHFKEKGVGFLMEKEVRNLNQLLGNPEKPYVAILGGAKVSDKIDVIEHMMQYVAVFLIGGGMAYTFLKAKGVDIGKSLVEEAKIHHAEKILKWAELKGIQIILPVDSVVTRTIEPNTPFEIKTINEPWNDLIGVDLGPKSIFLFQENIKKAKTIFWNGPMGVFEIPPFNKGTFAVASSIATTTALKIAGGGHSLDAIHQSGHAKDFTHLSTGGGASMEFLEGKSLPGLKALESK